jgi:nucleoside-diphosphate kinase
MPDGVHRAMNAVQAAGGQTARDSGWGKAGGSDLGRGYDPVLMRRDSCDDGVRTPFVAFLSHTERKSTNAPISPPPSPVFAPARPDAKPFRYVPRPVATERTLILVKPDAFERRLTGEMIARFERKGLWLVALKLMQADVEIANVHYDEHKEKPFFGELVEFITRGELVAMVLEGPNAVNAARQVIGATDPVEADAGSIRGEYGTEVTFNLVHGSDSPESSQREIGIWFPEL